jgi:glutamine synthetase
MVNKCIAEYIWIDGTKPVAKLRSKTKILDSIYQKDGVKGLICEQIGIVPVRKLFPAWSFDGSSTNQAS